MFGFLERWLVIGEETEDSVSRNEFNREIIILRLRVCLCVRGSSTQIARALYIEACDVNDGQLVSQVEKRGKDGVD